MVYLNEFQRDGKLFLSVMDKENDRSQSGSCFRVHRSLRRPGTNQTPAIDSSSFPSSFSIRMEKGAEDGSDGCFLQSTYHDKSSHFTEFPMLGRRIISGQFRWGPNMILYGEFSYIPLYWEWTEHVLSCFATRLQRCGLHQTVYASLYSYSRDIHVMRAFCECWCPTTNTLHTLSGEVSISLWDLYKLGGLPISGKIYDETIPSLQIFEYRDKQNLRTLPVSCKFLFAAFRCLEHTPGCEKGVNARAWIDFWCKKKLIHNPPARTRPRSSTPSRTQNPSGQIQPQDLCWSPDELDVFRRLGVPKEKRESTYLAAYLSCWLCVFALPETGDKVIRPTTFEIASMMASGTTFSLAIPVLASIYHGLNGITQVAKPSHSRSFFPCHYIYGWIAHYFKTHHVLQPPPPGPMMVRYSGSQMTRSDIGDARELIHEGRVSDLGCLMLGKNRFETLIDDGHLDAEKSSYLISLRDSFLPLRCGGATFYAEPYSPHRFDRQFGFCQGIPGALIDDPHTREVSYNSALLYWKRFLFLGSMSRGVLPCHSLALSQHVSPTYRAWWSHVTISDLRSNASVLQKSTEANPSKQENDTEVGSSRNVKGKKGKDPTTDFYAEELASGDGAGGFQGVHLADRKRGLVHGSDSEIESEANFRHGRRKKRETKSPKDARVTIGDDFFDDIQSCSSEAANLQDIEQLDLAQEAAPIVDEQLLEDVSHAARSPAPRATPGVGKDINVVMRQTSSPKVGSSTSKATETLRATVSQSQHSVDGPNSLEVATRELTSVAGVDIGTSGGSHERPVRVAAPSTTSFRPGPGSQHIFAAAIRVMGSEYLTTLKNSKFEEVEEKLQGVTMVYKGIERLCGDPTPLRKRVEDYGSAVAAFLSLKKATSSYRHPDDVARERASRIEQIELERSHLAKARADLGAATERLKEVDQKIGQLEDALRLARGERRQLEGDIQVHSSQVEGAEQVVDASSKALTDLEMVPTLSSDDARELERHEQVLLSLQSSLNPDTWMDVD